MKSKEEITFDKCQLCYYEAPSTEFIKGKCPICGSEDVDDANFDPYKDDDDEESW